jgi:hypothetical protein
MSITTAIVVNKIRQKKKVVKYFDSIYRSIFFIEKQVRYFKSIWFMVYGLWFVVWRLAFGVWCLVFGVWCLVFGVWCLWFGVIIYSRKSQPFERIGLIEPLKHFQNLEHIQPHKHLKHHKPL